MHKDSKRCPRCAADLPLTAFGSDRSRSDGKTAVCRSCRSRAYTLRRANSPALAFVDHVTMHTLCAHCGAQPVEWHNPEHVELNRERFRISAMVQREEPIALIQAEMERCTPLCRRCHMQEDGRLARFINAGRSGRDGASPPICSECYRLVEKLRGPLCGACAKRRYRRSKNERLRDIP